MTGSLQIGNGGDNGSLPAGTIATYGNFTVNSTRSFTLAGPIEGTGTVTVTGGGTHLFPSANSYEGGTLIAGAAAVRMGSSDALGTGAITVGNNNQSTSRLELTGGLTLNQQLNIVPRAYRTTDGTDRRKVNIQLGSRWHCQRNK